jgi:hypothetical protein
MRVAEQDRGPVGVELVGIREIFEHREDYGHERIELFAAFERQVVREWGAEHRVLGERLHHGGVIPSFHRDSKRELGVYRDHVDLRSCGSSNLAYQSA